MSTAPDGVPSRRNIDFERFFELSGDVMVVTGPDGRFERVNSTLVRLLGLTHEQILTSPWTEFVHPDDRESSEDENQQEFADEHHRTVRFENRYVDQRGQVHWMEWSAELDPESGLVYGTGRDVTTQRAARLQLEEARMRAEEAQALAEGANLAKSEFLSRMSHELRTPLNAVLGFAQLLELDEVDERRQESVQQVLQAGRHLLELIDEVLDIARIEVGTVPLSIKPVRAADLIADALSLVGPLAATGGVNLRSNVADPEAHVLADERRLHQVLVNYLANAIKYTPQGSTATIEMSSAADGLLRIAVVDDGLGIPPEMLDRLFKPFDRLGAEKTGVQGTGLGLAHSKALAEGMGATVGVDSVYGHGCAFWIDVPVSPVVIVAGEATLRPLINADDTVIGTLLYIEDSPTSARLVERILDRRPGLLMRAVGLGRLGLQMARELQPDLIALDLHLPDIAGEAVLTALRDDPRTSGIPVIILSADATRHQVERLLALGARDYLTKPIDVGRLLSVIDHFVTGG